MSQTGDKPGPKGRWPIASPLSPAPRLMLRESVYDAVKQLLMDQQVAPGSRLSIDALSRELEVSQTPVREALFRLEADGLVVRKPNAGYTVAPVLDEAGLLDLYDFRLILEPVAARRAAVHATEDGLAALREAMSLMAPDVSGDTYAAYRQFAEQDAEFHATIAAASGSPLISDTINRLRSQTHSYRLYFRQSIHDKALEEHTAIMNAIVGKDPDGAEAAMRAHLVASRTRLQRAYRKGKAPDGP